MSVRTDYKVECPCCNRDDRLSVECKIMCSLSTDGTVDQGGDHEWDDSSDMSCECGHSGVVLDFKIKDLVLEAETAVRNNPSYNNVKAYIAALADADIDDPERLKVAIKLLKEVT